MRGIGILGEMGLDRNAQGAYAFIIASFLLWGRNKQETKQTLLP